jgi:hypothetical protein
MAVINAGVGHLIATRSARAALLDEHPIVILNRNAVLGTQAIGTHLLGIATGPRPLIGVDLITFRRAPGCLRHTNLRTVRIAILLLVFTGTGTTVGL